MSVAYVDIDVLLDREQLATITRAAALCGQSIEAFIVAAVTKYTQILAPRSRNQREGRFVGHAEGRAVRWPKALCPRVRSARARIVLARRNKGPLPTLRYISKQDRIWSAA